MASKGPLETVFEYVQFWFDFLTNIKSLVGFFADFGISRALVLSIIYVGELAILSLQIPHLFTFAFEWLFGTLPLWLPIALYIGAFKIWVWYGQSLYLAGRKPVLLEVRMPREITKSPRAMEIVFTAFSLSAGEATFIARGWKGQVRPFFSFEIASFGGELHFYIWCWSNFKATVETAMYAQYPEVELYEVEDYAMKFRYDPKKYKAWGVEWPLETYMKIPRSDFRINAYPLRTYVDFELDKDPKEEFKIDPLSQILEFMGGISTKEQLWVQIILRKCGGVNGILIREDQDRMWKEMVEKEVQLLRAHAAIVPGAVLKQAYKDAGEDIADSKQPPQPRPSWKHQRMMESMERNLGKYPFEVGMRGIYWTEGQLSGPISTGFRWMWRPFGNPNFGTQLRPRRWHCDFDYPWQDFKGLRWINQTRRVLDAYRRRSFYHSPWVIPTNVMTNEVLASLWHPPSRAIVTPGLERIPATKSEPPPNLPK